MNLWRTYDRLREFEDELFSRYDLTPQQYNALRILRGESPKQIATLVLAGRLVSHAPDITRMLDKLASRGLISRDRPEHNRRMVLVGITAEGLDLLNELEEPVRECHRRQLGHLSSTDVVELVNLLRKARVPHEPAGSSWT